MNFKQGDHVVHPSFGVGVIASIEERTFSGNEPALFYRVDFSKTTVWVPLRSQPKVELPHSDLHPSGLRSGALRHLIHESELNRYRTLLKSSPVPLGDDFRKRQVELTKRVETGTFQSLCEIVRDLNALNTSKHLNSYEKNLYKHTREALAVEWSTTCGLSHADAMSEIDGYLDQGKLSAIHG